MDRAACARWVRPGCGAWGEAARHPRLSGQTARNAGTDRKRPAPAFKDGPILGVVPIVLGGPSFRVR